MSSAICGEKVKRIRQERGLTQVQVATLLGVKQSYISMIERGRRILREDLLAELCAVLGCSKSDIHSSTLSPLDTLLSNCRLLRATQVNKINEIVIELLRR